MIPNKTTVVRPLSSEAINNIKQELQGVSWTLHHDSSTYLRGGALRFGETSWIVKYTEYLEIIEDNSSMFVASEIIANSFLEPGEILGRRYWHRLHPGNIIEKHDDSDLGFTKHILNRYQIFLDIPDGFEIFCDNEYKIAKDFENSVADFNLLLPHAYKNSSSETVYLMVFDVFSENNKPHRTLTQP